MSEFTPVGNASDIEPGAWQKFQVGGNDVVVFNVEGEFHAIDDTCPHRGGPLSHGFLEGCIVYCPLHGWPFDVTTGEMPGAPEICVPRYPVKVEQGRLLVGRPIVSAAAAEAAPEAAG